MPPAAVVHVICAVDILEHELVDRLRSVDYLVDERPAEYILIWAFGPIRTCDADSALTLLVHVVAAEEQIIRSILPDDRRSPHRLPQPLHLVVVDDALMLRPVYQVLGREGVKVGLFLERKRSGREYPVFVVPDHGLRIGISARKNRVAGIFVLLRTTARQHCSHHNGSEEKSLIHESRI